MKTLNCRRCSVRIEMLEVTASQLRTNRTPKRGSLATALSNGALACGFVTAELQHL
jgi:hypothetical protein